MEVTSKLIKKVLEETFWPETLTTDYVFERFHDDHDGKFDKSVKIVVDKMGDVWLSAGDRPEYLRFRTYGGGGASLRVRNALLILAEAIRLDNLDKKNGPSKI